MCTNQGDSKAHRYGFSYCPGTARLQKRRELIASSHDNFSRMAAACGMDWQIGTTTTGGLRVESKVFCRGNGSQVAEFDCLLPSDKRTGGWDATLIRIRKSLEMPL